jgi:hypothetical protein
VTALQLTEIEFKVSKVAVTVGVPTADNVAALTARMAVFEFVVAVAEL